MGQKVHPILMRVVNPIIGGSSKGQLSQFGYRNYNFFAKTNKEFALKFTTAFKIENYIKKTFDKFSVSNVYINFVQNTATVDIFSGKVGYLIGKAGAGVDAIRKKVLDLTKDANITAAVINIHEVKKPNLDASIVAEELCKEVQKKRGTANIKRMADTIMKSGAVGVKIRLAGRISGAEIARDDKVKRGLVNATTIKANVSYAQKDIRTSYGIIGVSVYINLGI